MSGITIVGTGRYLPERVVENQEFTEFLETSDEWIQSHTGIQRRRISLDEPVWYMGAKAAEQALEAAGVAAEDVDMIISTTVTPDYYYPSLACLVQGYLGNEKAFCFDVAAACAGFTYAMDMAQRYLSTGGAETILLVSAEALSKVTDYEDRGSCILFGDGAGACVLRRGEGMFHAHLGSDGTGGKHLYSKHHRPKTPFFDRAPNDSMETFLPEKLIATVMNGHEVYRFATKVMTSALKAACEKAGLMAADLDLVIPHQANLRIIKTALRGLGISMERVFTNIAEYGNTSSASIPICIDECMRSGRLKPGDKLGIVGFGAGLVYGACVLEV